MKEKIELSLDNRQVAGLFIAGVVVLGAVFVLGVVVGKKLVVENRANVAPNLLSTLDAKVQALERVHEEPPPLTFPEELTKKLPPDPEQASSAPAKPASASAAPSASSVPTHPPPTPKDLAALPTGPGAAPAGRKEESQVPVRISEKALKTSGPPPISAASIEKRGPYTLQLSAVQTQAEAEKFAQGLRHKGYSPYIVQAHVPNKGTWFRVRLGHFSSKEQAGRYLKDFQRETQMGAYIAGE